MQNFPTLKLLDRFERIYTRFGVDYKTMRKILQIKLLMDRRRVPTIFNQQAKKKDENKDSNGFIKSLWMYAFFGLFLIPFLVIDDHYVFQMSIVFGILMFLIMTSMISDFSSVLLDIRDRNILYPKPVSKKTLSAAKLTHISIYMCLLTFSIIAIPLIVGIVKHGLLFFIVSVISIFLIDILVVVLTALLYMLVLKFFDGEKLKDFINYVQIGLSLSIMIGYQLLVRSFEIVDLTVTIDPQWWHIFIFPMWYGAFIEMLLNGIYSFYYIILSLCGIIIPIISLLIYLQFLSNFEKNLQKLSTHGKGKETKKIKIKEKMIHLICTSKTEKAFFRFASIMMKNERDFKLKVYPSLGFTLVLPFIFLINLFSGSTFAEVSTSKSYLSIYFSLLIIPSVIIMLKFSGKYKGAWIYRITPLQDLKPAFSGTMKAFIIKLYFPLYVLLSAFHIGIFGVRIIPDLLVVFLHACLYGVVCFLILEKTLPFSESFEAFQQSSSWIIFLLMFIVPIFAGLHFISLLVSYGIYVYALLLLSILPFIWRKSFQIKWNQLS